jgi:hypothetical protein
MPHKFIRGAENYPWQYPWREILKYFEKELARLSRKEAGDLRAIPVILNNLASLLFDGLYFWFLGVLCYTQFYSYYIKKS